MLLQQTSESEQRRRQQVTRDSRTAPHLGITYEKAVERREEAARDWLRFLRTEMAALGANDPAEIPHVLAYRIEMKSAETACAVAKIVAKQTVREMLSTPASLALVPYIHINRLVIELQRPRVYTFPPLNDCRGQFADMIQQNIKWDGPEDTRQMRGTARVQLAKMRLDEATGSFVYKRKRAKPLI